MLKSVPDLDLFFLGAAVGALGAAGQIREGRTADDVADEARVLVDTLARMIAHDRAVEASLHDQLAKAIADLQAGTRLRTGPIRPRGPRRADGSGVVPAAGRGLRRPVRP